MQLAHFLAMLVAFTIFAAAPSVQGMHHASRVVKRQADLDADQLAAASQALSIYNSIGTTAFASPTAGVCAAGLQAYTASTGRLRCCVGSIVNGICFSDTEDIVYDADPYAVLDGTAEAPADDDAGTAATTTAVVRATTSSRRASSTINYLTATTFTPTYIAASTRGVATSTSSQSQRSLTLTPTGSASTVTSGALHLDAGSAILGGLLGSAVALVGLIVVL